MAKGHKGVAGMKGKWIDIIVLIAILAVIAGLAVGGFFLTKAIIESDLPVWWKWILLK